MNDFEKMSTIAKANGRIWSANLASNFIRANRHSKGWDITIGVGHDAGDLFSAGYIVGALYMVHVDEWKVNRADLVAEKDARIAELEAEIKRQRKTMTGDAMHRQIAERCRDEIQLALPGWNWQDPVRDTLHAHPLEQLVNVALRRLRTENERIKKVADEAIAFASIEATWGVDDLDQRAGFTLDCDYNDVEIPHADYETLAAYLREKAEVQS